MKPNYSPPKQTISLARFKALPAVADTTVDVAAIQQRLNPWLDNPVRVRRGTFKVPWDASTEVYLKLRNQAVRTFLVAMGKEGWDWIGTRIKVDIGRFMPMDPDGNKLPGYKEYVVRAQFRKRDFQPVVIEIPH